MHPDGVAVFSYLVVLGSTAIVFLYERLHDMNLLHMLNFRSVAGLQKNWPLAISEKEGKNDAIP